MITEGSLGNKTTRPFSVLSLKLQQPRKVSNDLELSSSGSFSAPRGIMASAAGTAGELITLNLDKGRQENRRLIEVRKDRVAIPSTGHGGSTRPR
jgi:hypothetical protein